MHQVKLFKSVEADVAELEKEINQWLAESGVRVVTMFGNIAPQSSGGAGAGGLSKSPFAPSDVLVAILYEE